MLVDPDAKLLPALEHKVEWAAELLGFERNTAQWKEIVEWELKKWKSREINPERIFFPLDDGREEPVTAILALHYCPYRNDTYKGGINRSHTGTPDACRSSAFLMTWKAQIVRAEWGGAKLYIVHERDSLEYSETEANAAVKAVARHFVRCHYFKNDEYTYIPAPDAGTTPKNMDEISQIFGQQYPAPVTGRTIRNGGIPWREEATGHGGLIVFETLLNLVPSPITDTEEIRVVLQGTGMVGRHFALLSQNPQFTNRKYRFVAISNARGGIINPDGIDVSALPNDPNASLRHLGGTPCLKEDVLYQDCDLLVLAATSNAITAENAHRISTTWVNPLGNSAIHPAAESILAAKNILFPNSFHANAGGLCLSHEEYKESHSGPILYVRRDEVKTRVVEDLRETLDGSTKQIVAIHKRFNVSLSDAAWIFSTYGVLVAALEKHEFSRLKQYRNTLLPRLRDMQLT